MYTMYSALKVDTPLSGDTLLSASDPYMYLLSTDLDAVDVIPTPLRKLQAELDFSQELSNKLLRAVPSLPTPTSPPAPLSPKTPVYAYDPANPYRDAKTSPSTLPPSYTPLPHCHPPRFSSRLRSLASQRPRPLMVNLSAQPKGSNEKQEVMQTILTVESAAWPPTPKGGLEGWLMRWDPRIVLVLGVLGIMAVLGVGASVLAGKWAQQP